VYDFALPLLIIHAFHFHSAEALKGWLAICPRRQITCLDTHDGMGVDDIQVGGGGGGVCGCDLGRGATRGEGRWEVWGRGCVCSSGPHPVLCGVQSIGREGVMHIWV
jgi:hypothetical protein